MCYSTTCQSSRSPLANGTYQRTTITSPATPSIMPIPRISPGLPENILAPPPRVETEEEIAIAENSPTMTERNHLDCEVLKRAMALYMVYGIHSNEMMIINCGVIVMRCGVCGVISQGKHVVVDKRRDSHVTTRLLSLFIILDYFD